MGRGGGWVAQIHGAFSVQSHIPPFLPGVPGACMDGMNMCPSGWTRHGHATPLSICPPSPSGIRGRLHCLLPGSHRSTRERAEKRFPRGSEGQAFSLVREFGLGLPRKGGGLHFFNFGFFWVYAYEWDCWVIWWFYSSFFKEFPYHLL